MSERRPTPREPRRRPSDLSAALVCVALIQAVGLFVLLARTFAQPEEEEEPELPTHAVLTTHDSLAPTYTYDGEVIRWYVLEDPDYGIQYLVNDRGGCCVRLDSYGGVAGVRYE